MEKVDKSIEVDVPVRVAYNQWTQFETFPRFMDGVDEVRQVDDTHLHWRATIAGKQEEWDVEITEQVPDQTIGWASTSGVPNAGAVRFQPVTDDRTRVDLTMEYEPRTLLERMGDAVGIVSRKIDKTVQDFKRFVEERGRETGAWRGEVHGGQETSAPGGQSGASTGMAGTQAAGGTFSGFTGGSQGATGRADATPEAQDLAMRDRRG
jgi:uncharacterized membrane protein